MGAPSIIASMGVEPPPPPEASPSGQGKWDFCGGLWGGHGSPAKLGGVTGAIISIGAKGTRRKVLFTGGHPGAVPDPPPPLLSGGPKCLRGPDHWRAKMFERSRPSCKPIWRIWLAPQALENFGSPLKGLAGPVTPCVYTPNAQFFWAFSLPPTKAGFVQPLLILWPYRSFPTMETNGDKCRLLLIEDPAHSVSKEGVLFVVPPPLRGAKMSTRCQGQGLHLGPPPLGFVNDRLHKKGDACTYSTCC